MALPATALPYPFLPSLLVSFLQAQSSLVRFSEGNLRVNEPPELSVLWRTKHGTSYLGGNLFSSSEFFSTTKKLRSSFLGAEQSTGASSASTPLTCQINSGNDHLNQYKKSLRTHVAWYLLLSEYSCLAVYLGKERSEHIFRRPVSYSSKILFRAVEGSLCVTILTRMVSLVIIRASH